MNPLNPINALVTLNSKGLQVGYDRQSIALAIPELTISGNCIALLGHNGSGKSTLLKTLLKLTNARHGTIAALQVNPETGAEEILSPQTDIAFCPEAGSVFLDVSVDAYLAFWGRLRLNDADAHHSLPNQALLSELGVLELRRKLGRELSKGQRRRVHAAAGFLIKPKLFLFDEPFDGLDIRHTSALVSCIERLKPTTSFIISSHRIDIVERLCDAAIVLRDGRVITSGTLPQVTQALGGATLSAGMMG